MTTLHLPNTVKTGGIVLPPSVNAEIDADRRAVVENMHSIMAVRRDWEPYLKQIDEHLELLRATDQTTVVGLKAGYWHVIRVNPGHPADVLPLEYEDGTFREPGSWMIDYVMECDFWNDSARKVKKERAKRAEESRARAKEREREDRVCELSERINSARNTQILVRRNI